MTLNLIYERCMLFFVFFFFLDLFVQMQQVRFDIHKHKIPAFLFCFSFFFEIAFYSLFLLIFLFCFVCFFLGRDKSGFGIWPFPDIFVFFRKKTIRILVVHRSVGDNEDDSCAHLFYNSIRCCCTGNKSSCQWSRQINNCIYAAPAS